MREFSPLALLSVCRKSCIWKRCGSNAPSRNRLLSNIIPVLKDELCTSGGAKISLKDWFAVAVFEDQRNFSGQQCQTEQTGSWCAMAVEPLWHGMGAPAQPRKQIWRRLILSHTDTRPLVFGSAQSHAHWHGQNSHRYLQKQISAQNKRALVSEGLSSWQFSTSSRGNEEVHSPSKFRDMEFPLEVAAGNKSYSRHCFRLIFACPYASIASATTDHQTP